MVNVTTQPLTRITMNQELLTLMENSFKELREHSIVKGIILDIKPQVVLVDIGYKSEGAIPVSEFEDEDIQVGDAKVFKGYAKVFACDAAGVAELMLQKRDAPVLFKELKQGTAPSLHRWTHENGRITRIESPPGTNV